MKKLLLPAIFLSAAAHGQTFYQCPDTSRAGQNAHTGSECSNWVWSPPRADYLIASCGQPTCSWTSATKWRRVTEVPATAAVAACTGTVNGRACSQEAWLIKGTRFDPPPNPQPPPPPPIAGITASSGSIWQSESISLTWWSRNATACSASWDNNAVPLQQETPRVVGPFTFPTTLNFDLTCTGPNGPAWTTRSTVVVKSLAPSRYIHDEDRAKAHWEFLDAIDPAYPEYNAKGVWCENTPNGVVQNVYAFNVLKVAREYLVREQQGNRYNEALAREDCDRNCKLINPGQLRTEMDAFAVEWPCTRLGVVE